MLEQYWRRRQALRGAIVGALLALVVVAVAWLYLVHRTPPRPAHTAPATHKSATPAPVTPAGLQTHVMFVGDMFWDRATNRRAMASPLKEAYPFSRLSEFGREHYDAWVANLECPSVPGVQQPYDLEVSSLLFNCPTSYLPEMAKWFTAVSLANNHSANQQGQPGLDATRTALAEQHVQFFGHFDPRKLEDVCEVVSLPARMQLSNHTEQTTQLPIALCGYHGVATTPPAESLAVMQRYAKLMPVFAYPHMGTEYKATADPIRQQVYRAMIDNGADAVLGGHPHWVQPAEVYKGKLIIYSMGNFIFDQPAGETQRGAAIDLTLQSTASISPAQLQAWTTLAQQCSGFHDDCLQQAEAQHLVRLPLSFTYAIRGVDMSSGRTHLASGATEQAILERLNWAAVSQLLTAPQQ